MRGERERLDEAPFELVDGLPRRSAPRRFDRRPSALGASRRRGRGTRRSPVRPPRRISTIGPSSTTAERRPAITTATRSPPAAAIDTSSRPPSDSRRSPRRRRVAPGRLSLRRLAHPSVVQRSLEPRLARSQLVRRRSVELGSRELDGVRAGARRARRRRRTGTLGTAGRGSAVPGRCSFHPHQQVPWTGVGAATRMARSTMSRAWTSMAALRVPRCAPASRGGAFEFVERGAEMATALRRNRQPSTRGRRRGVRAHRGASRACPPARPPRRRRRRRSAWRRRSGAGRRRRAVASDRAATSPLALPTAASSAARASRRSRSDIPS